MLVNIDYSSLKSDFERDGHLVLRGFIGQDKVAEVLGEIDRYVKQVAPLLPQGMVYYEDVHRPDTLQRLNEMSNHDAYFRRMLAGGNFVELAELLLDGPVNPYHALFFNKPPHDGLPTPAHQDGYYIKLEPPEAVTMWLALEAIDQENGCMRYIRGSHRHGLRNHGMSGVLGFSQGITDFGTADRVYEIVMRAQPGDLLVHHCLTIHLADGNASSRTRKAMGLNYFSQRAKQDPQRIALFRQQVNENLARAGKI